MPKHRVYTKELLEPLVKDSFSVAQVCKKLGIRPDGSSSSMIKRKLINYNIDFSHFRGAGANFGINHKGGFVRKKWQDVLTPQKDGHKYNHRKLHNALQDMGRPYLCEGCGLKANWCDKVLVLHIDHINGDSYDHRPENLRYLCPNCHSQTGTYCGKNKSRHGEMVNTRSSNLRSTMAL